jgi:hypothetical protein
MHKTLFVKTVRVGDSAADGTIDGAMPLDSGGDQPVVLLFCWMLS